MINLLPDTYKKELGAARTNVILLRYNFLFLGVAGFIAVSSVFVYLLLSSNKSQAEKTNQDNSSREVEYASTKTAADQYRLNLETAKKILDNEVNYTDKVFTITRLLPSGVTLDSLTLDASSFGKPTILSAHAKDYNAVSDLKRSFENAKNVFSNVHFQSIAVDGSNTTGYPIAVSINVTINKAGASS